ncbi:MAG: choice-of-anchor L domain-containing protein, partial [Bacteroidota bacterium]
MHITRIFLLPLLLFWGTQLLAQLEVTNAPPITPENLISNVFLGEGVEVVDIEFNGDPLSVGLFTQGTDAVRMERGIVMTTGRAVTEGPFLGVDSPAGNLASVINNSTATDGDLTAIVGGGGIGINNVCQYIIEFIPVN